MAEKPGHVDAATHRYGCHGKPRPTAATVHMVQDGWTVGIYGIERNMIPCEHVMSTACQYDRSQYDQACFGCPHQKGALA